MFNRKRSFEPWKIGNQVYDISGCFFTFGVGNPGYIGMMAQGNLKNHTKFTRQAGYYGGGIIVLPSSFKLGLRDLSFADKYGVTYTWNRAFGGVFPHNGQVYNVTSLTLDIANVSEARMLEIVQDIARNHFQTDVILKIYLNEKNFFG